MINIFTAVATHWSTRTLSAIYWNLIYRPLNSPSFDLPDSVWQPLCLTCSPPKTQLQKKHQSWIAKTVALSPALLSPIDVLPSVQGCSRDSTLKACQSMVFSPGTLTVHDSGCFWNLVLMEDGIDTCTGSFQWLNLQIGKDSADVSRASNA